MKRKQNGQEATTMTQREARETIATTIINMEKPFTLTKLFAVCEAIGIVGQSLILEVLEELCDRGTVSYFEIRDDRWTYKCVA